MELMYNVQHKGAVWKHMGIFESAKPVRLGGANTDFVLSKLAVRNGV